MKQAYFQRTNFSGSIFISVYSVPDSGIKNRMQNANHLLPAKRYQYTYTSTLQIVNRYAFNLYTTRREVLLSKEGLPYATIFFKGYDQQTAGLF